MKRIMAALIAICAIVLASLPAAAQQTTGNIQGRIVDAQKAAIPGVTCAPPRGAFYVWAEVDASLYRRLGVNGADELSSKLAANGIGSAPGDAFGEHCVHAIRFAFSCDTEMVHTGSGVLRAALMGDEQL